MNHGPALGNQSKISSPAELCEKYDKGGGTGLQGTFAIYSIRALPESCTNLNTKLPELFSRLEHAARKVAETIPIYFNLGDIDEDDLYSFSTSSPAPHAIRTQTPRLPWFLVNAAIVEEHCIVGRETAVESLLVILRRPWCILEVCCCDYLTVSTMLDFAILAQQVDPKGYAASVLLLSHEKSNRKIVPSEVSPSPLDLDNINPHPSSEDLKAVYTVLSADGMKSHNPFWLQVICVCGVQLGIAFSDFLRGMCATKVVLIPERIGSPNRLSVGMVRRAFTEDLSLSRRQISDHEQRAGFQVHSQRLVSLYKQVLQRLTEELL